MKIRHAVVLIRRDTLPSELIQVNFAHLSSCRAHFDYDKMKDNEFSFQREDVFHIWDTMHDGVIGSWRAQIITKTGLETDVGIIPNKSR